MSKLREMPDVAHDSRAPVSGTLDRVGMSKIEVAVKLASDGLGEFLVPAFADAYVNLSDPQAKGIHMSRLFLHLHDGLKRAHLSPALLSEITGEFLKTHKGISTGAYLNLEFQLPLMRHALLSKNSAYRHYAVKLSVQMEHHQTRTELEVVVPYSSTCPCSAALARQLIQEEFLKDHGAEKSVSVETVSQWLRKETSIIATPHSQRSYATVGLRYIDAPQTISHEKLIDLVENALKTPVQAVVKREDEQEFARLNGTNLMFCEDAGRKLAAAVAPIAGIHDYRIKVSHEESLHPHNAVAMVSGGKSGRWDF